MPFHLVLLKAQPMNKQTAASLATLANAIELGAAVVLKVAGNAVANTVNGKLVSSDDLKSALAAQIQSSLTKQSGVL